MKALMCKKHEVKREEKDALLAYFVKLSMPTLRGRARNRPYGQTNKEDVFVGAQ